MFVGDSRSLLEQLYIYAAPTTNKNLIAGIRRALAVRWGFESNC